MYLQRGCKERKALYSYGCIYIHLYQIPYIPTIPHTQNSLPLLSIIIIVKKSLNQTNKTEGKDEKKDFFFLENIYD